MRFERKYYLDELIARKHNGMVKIITGLSAARDLFRMGFRLSSAMVIIAQALPVDEEK